jgi:hypothetical protein
VEDEPDGWADDPGTVAVKLEDGTEPLELLDHVDDPALEEVAAAEETPEDGVATNEVVAEEAPGDDIAADEVATEEAPEEAPEDGVAEIAEDDGAGTH